MKNKKVFVTGGTGFIGANLIRKLLDSNNETFVLARRNSNFWRIKDVLSKVKIVEGDLLKDKNLKTSIQKIKPQIVYHLATHGAYSYQNKENEILKTNIFGTLNLLNACKYRGLQLLINTGSSSEYGFKKRPMKETDALEPNSYYAIAKSAQTYLCSYFAHSIGYPIVTLRPFSVYGPYEQPLRLMPNMMKAFFDNSILNMVSKKTVRDFIYIDDYVDVCLNIKLLKKYTGEIFNIGSGREINFKELIDTFQKVTGKKGSVKWDSFPPKEWDTKSWQADISKSKKLLKFKPRYTLAGGLKKNWEWFQSYSSYYENN